MDRNDTGAFGLDALEEGLATRPRRRFVSIKSPYGYAACGYLYRYFMYECVGVLSK